MKIWNGYGSEHSMNLVLIGKFKQEQDAEKVEKDIKTLSTQAEKDECYSLPLMSQRINGFQMKCSHYFAA